MGWFCTRANTMSSEECEFVCGEIQQIHHRVSCVFQTHYCFVALATRFLKWIARPMNTSTSALQNPATDSNVRLHLCLCAVGNQQLLLWLKSRGQVFGVGWNAVALTLSAGLRRHHQPWASSGKSNRSWNHLSGAILQQTHFDLATNSNPHY